MADSDQVTITADQPVSIVVRKERASSLLRDSSGRFLRKEKQMIPTRDITSLLRRLINARERLDDGTSLRRIERMFKAVYKIVVSENDDPKAMMAKVQAFEALMARAFGKVPVSDEDRDAMKQAGVQVLIIPHPELANKSVEEQKPKETIKPAFIDAEFEEVKEE